jgi:hypothetical protein
VIQQKLPSSRKNFTRQDQDIEYDDRINFFGGMIATSEVEIYSAIHAQIGGGVRIDAINSQHNQIAFSTTLTQQLDYYLVCQVSRKQPLSLRT